MRNHLVSFASPVVVLGVIGALVGCGAKDNGSPSGAGAGATGSGASTTTGGGQGGGGGTTTGTGAGSTTDGSTTNGSTGTTSTGTGAGTTGWTPVALIDDNSDPANTVFRGGNDLVTGIFFSSINAGWVTTAGSNESFQNGGAVFKATQKQITKILFSGNRDGLCQLGSIDFHGIDKNADGFVALAYACDVIASHDGGQTFTITPALAGDSFGIESVLAMRTRATDTLMVSESGYLSVTNGAPGPNALWTDIWAPEAVPTIPDPVPANECQGAPHSGVPTQHTSVYVSPDGNLVAYVAAPNMDPQICLSTDGGKTFFPKLLPNIPDDALDFSPLGVTFANATTGIAFWGNSVYPGLAYIYRTTDTGATWTKVAVPADYATRSIELASAFFAPDGMHGFIVGYDYDDSIPILLSSADGGATWKRSGGDLAAKVAAADGDKLFTGFALDATHIWVGGDHGILMASDTGGE